MELMELLSKFNTQNKCIKYLENARWKEKISCPYCNSTKCSTRKKENRHHCSSCNKSFSVLVGTIFESTKLPLPKWFMAIHLILNAKKGIASRQLARHINVTKDTAWLIQKRLREAMKNEDEDDNDNFGLLSGIVEADETYVGGNTGNKHKKERDELHASGKVGTGGNHKIPVLGALERKGHVKTVVLKATNGKVLKPIIRDLVDISSTIVTDGFGGYSGLEKEYNRHEVIRHSQNEYEREGFHTNGIEGFWSLVKRGIIGQYHKITREYLQSYLDEFSYKFNHKDDKDIFELFMNNALTTILSRKQHAF